MDCCSADLCLADNRKRCFGNTVLIGLLMYLAFSANRQLKFGRESVYNGYAHTMQAARDFIGVVVKFTACMKHRHDDFRSTDTLFMYLGGNSSAIITNSDGLVGMNNHSNFRAMTSEGLID